MTLNNHQVEDNPQFIASIPSIMQGVDKVFLTTSLRISYFEYDARSGDDAFYTVGVQVSCTTPPSAIDRIYTDVLAKQLAVSHILKMGLAATNIEIELTYTEE